MAGVSVGAICIIIAVVVFAIGAVWNPAPRYSLQSAGLAFFAAAVGLGV